jgi:hypothetical protein
MNMNSLKVVAMAGLSSLLVVGSVSAQPIKAGICIPWQAGWQD